MTEREKKLKELKLLMLEKERRRRESAKEAEANEARLLEGAKELAVDIPVKAAQGATFGFSDELYGAGKALVTDQPYEEARDEARAVQERASERSPVSSFMAEIAGGALTGAGVARKAGTGLATTMAESAVYGAGETEEEEPLEIAKEAGTSALTGGALHGLSKVARYPTKRPSDIRAHYTGKGTSEFKKLGEFGDPVDMAEALNEIDFFKFKKSVYDVKRHKFVPLKKGMLPPTIDDSISNASDAIKKISKKKNALISNKKGKVVFKDIKSDMQNAMRSLVNRSENPERTMQLISSEVEPLMKEMKDGISYARLEKLKQNWQDASSKYYDKLGGVAPEFTEVQKVKAGIAGILKNKMELDVDGVMKLNESSRYLRMAEDGLRNERAFKRGKDPMTGTFSPIAGVPYYAKKTFDFIGGGERGSLARARIGEHLDAPGIAREAGEMAGQVGEFGALGPRKATVPEMASEGAIQALKAKGSTMFTNKREPQSIAEEVVRWKIPRSTEAVIENKDMILAKVAQMEPMQYDNIKEVLENEQDKIPDLVPLLAQTMPHLFESDKYGRFDGIIYDPAKKQLAREDINLNESLSNSQKMLMMNQLNKTGEFDL